MTPALKQNIWVDRQLQGGIIPNYLPGQRKGRIRMHNEARNRLQRHVNEAEPDEIHLQRFRARVTTDAKTHGLAARAGRSRQVSTGR